MTCLDFRQSCIENDWFWLKQWCSGHTSIYGFDVSVLTLFVVPHTVRGYNLCLSC